MRSVSAIQADLDAAYSCRRRILSGAQVSQLSTGQSFTYADLDKLGGVIADLKSELAEATASASGETTGGLVITRLIRG